MNDDMRPIERAAAQSGERPEGWQVLENALKKIPAVGSRELYWGFEAETGIWWCTFQIDQAHPNCFDTIYALGHSLNHYSGSDFAGAFYPTGPYYGANESSDEFLEWMIDSMKGQHS